MAEGKKAGFEEDRKVERKVELDDRKIDEIAELAKLEFEDKEKIKKDIKRILEFVSQIAELDLEGVEPTSWTLGFSQRLREDEPQDFEKKDMIVKGFPKSRGKFAVVPRVVKGK